MSRLSTIRSFHAVEVAVALGSSTQSALAADACDVPVSVRTEAISAGALGQGLHDVIGCVENTLRHDFCLDIVRAGGHHEDAAEPEDAR